MIIAVKFSTLTYLHLSTYVILCDPASYTGGPGFKSWPGDRLSWLRTTVLSSVPLGECWGIPLKLDHDSVVPNSFQVIIHLSPFHLTLHWSLIMSMVWDFISELRPPTGLLFNPQVIAYMGWRTTVELCRKEKTYDLSTRALSGNPTSRDI
jgi:hypothetical protein